MAGVVAAASPLLLDGTPISSKIRRTNSRQSLKGSPSPSPQRPPKPTGSSRGWGSRLQALASPLLFAAFLVCAVRVAGRFLGGGGGAGGSAGGLFRPRSLLSGPQQQELAGEPAAGAPR